MQEERASKAKRNMLTTVLRQLATTLCGLLIPHTMIGAFGSAAYGATTSIAQFLSYVTLLEGGIGRVARGALYKHLADKDSEKISKVHTATKAFFRNVGLLFLVYLVVLALSYYDLADVTEFSRKYTFALVIAIGLSTIANYFCGISNMTLLHADQKQYLTNTIITVTNIINALSIVLLVRLNADILTVKLVSSIIFVVRPLLYTRYVKKHYALPRVKKDPSVLSQKWTGMGQHIAYFIHTNTDVILLTLLADLKTVAVYSVYHMVSYSIWNITSAFSGGMEAAFGEMIAKNEKQALSRSYKYYKLILTSVSMTLFGCAIILIIPFVRLYTANVSDANYIQPLFGIVLMLAEFLNCVTLPCSTLPISANCLKESRWGAYGEALINIAVSLALICWDPLLGVALGTLAATAFKAIYYIVFATKNLLNCSVWDVLKKFLLSLLALLAISLVGMHLLGDIPMRNFVEWALWGVGTFAAVCIFVMLYCWAAYPAELKAVFHKVTYKFRHRA